jgi:hypothetical protein
MRTTVRSLSEEGDTNENEHPVREGNEYGVELLSFRLIGAQPKEEAEHEASEYVKNYCRNTKN